MFTNTTNMSDMMTSMNQHHHHHHHQCISSMDLVVDEDCTLQQEGVMEAGGDDDDVASTFSLFSLTDSSIDMDEGEADSFLEGPSSMMLTRSSLVVDYKQEQVGFAYSQRNDCAPFSPYPVTINSSSNESMPVTNSNIILPTPALIRDEIDHGMAAVVARPRARRTQNFMSDLPDDVLCQVGSFLNVGSLKMARLVNRRFRNVLSRDDAGWNEHCQRLWHRKVHVSEQVLHQYYQQYQQRWVGRRQPAIEAYRLSCMDGRLRHEISMSELCFNPARGPAEQHKGTVWSFRFKESAGAGWTSFDPWHAGGEARKMVFLPDGRVQQIVESANGKGYEFRQPFFDGTGTTTAPRRGVEIRWKHVSQPMDLPQRQLGAYVRLTIGGRDVPTYIVHRSPNGNWGFLMENCWGVFASFPLPRRPQPGMPTAVVGQGPSTATAASNSAAGVRMRLRRGSNGDGRWLNVSGIESDEDDESATVHDHQRREMAMAAAAAVSAGRHATNVIPTSDHNSSSNKLNSLLDDSSLPVTNNWQWREALLYNLGAATLPDGPHAVEEFDREWGTAIPM